MFTGISDANRVNIGILLEYRSNTIQGRNILTPFDFKNDPFKRSELSSIAPAIKFTPIQTGEDLRCKPLLVFPYWVMK